MQPTTIPKMYLGSITIMELTILMLKESTKITKHKILRMKRVVPFENLPKYLQFSITSENWAFFNWQS